jgi:hypothetical protein
MTDSWPASRLQPVDDAGWPGRSGYSGEATDGPAHPTRRFAEADLVPRTGIRPGLVVVLVVVTLLALAATAVISLASRGRSTSTPPAAGPSSAPANPDGPPTGVRLIDRGASIVLTWTDPAHGTVSFVIVGTGPNHQPLQVRQVPQGSTTVVYDSLSPSAKYCFRVGAVYAFNQVKAAPEVCTRR